MKIVDSFLFSEAYEAELLLVKLINEAPLVSEWCLVESTHTFRGEFKGLQARRLIESNRRFRPYRERITFFEHRGRLFDGPPGYPTYYENEERSRESVLDHVLAKYTNEDFVLVSDVDESVDASDPERKATFLRHLEQHAKGVVTPYFGHYRYWYDFDNRCYWAGIYTPVVRVGNLRSGNVSLRCRSRHPRHVEHIPAGKKPLVFEYTFCFPPEAMWRKLNSFIHDGYTPEELSAALSTNHWVKAAARGERPGERMVDWLETVNLTPQNSPAYVRENLQYLKTHAIPTDYRQQRTQRYGIGQTQQDQ